MVHVSARKLLLDECRANPAGSGHIKRCVESGELVPESIINQLVEQRLRQADCRINGFVLEGYPQTQSQLNHVTAMRIPLGVVILFEQTEYDANKRFQKKRIDPETGDSYNLNIDLIRDDALKNRLVQQDCDGPRVIARGFEIWNDHLADVEEYFKGRLTVVDVAGQSMEDIGDKLADAVMAHSTQSAARK